MDNPPRDVLATLCNPDNGYSSITFSRLDFFGFELDQDPTLLPIEEREGLLDAPFWLVDGINEHGVVVSIASLDPVNITIDKSKRSIYITHLIREILDHAKSCDEAVEIMKSYNIYDNGRVTSHHYLISDPSGGSVIAEYHDGGWRFIERDRTWQVMTNSPLYGVSEDLAEGSCFRYKSLNDKLGDESSDLDWIGGMKLLKSVSYFGTQWSAIYDMKERSVYVVIDGEFERVQRIRLR